MRRMFIVITADSAENITMSYIHENPDWPNLRWDDTKLLSLLADVRHRQGRLLGRMEGLGFRLRTEASLTTLTADVIKSSAIEGALLDAEQVRSSIARRLGLDFGGHVQSSRDVEGVVEMMLDATQKYAEPLTTERLFSWHASLFPTGRSGMRRITVGAWHPAEIGPMRVVSGPVGRERVHFEAPAADRLEHEVSVFLDWFGAANGIDPVLKAGIAHFRFVTVAILKRMDGHEPEMGDTGLEHWVNSIRRAKPIKEDRHFMLKPVSRRRFKMNSLAANRAGHNPHGADFSRMPRTNRDSPHTASSCRKQ